MAITWSFDEEQKFFLEVWEGWIIADDACAAVDEVVGDPRYGPGMSGLLDMRRASIRFDLAGIHAIFAKKSEYPAIHAGWRWALLAATTEQIAACSVYVSVADSAPVEMATFQDEDDALRWLGVTAPTRSH
jgi:hypothetical protein